MSDWSCRACSAKATRPYRYPPGPDAYCGSCGQSLTTQERGVETLRGLLAYLERNGLSLPEAHDAPPSPPGTPSAPFLTVEEVASLLRTTPKGVYARAARGQLPGAVHVGRALRFRRSELLSFLSEGRAPSSRR